MYAAVGTSFYYGNIGLLIAGRVAEVVSGKSWQQLFKEKIALPCKMNYTEYAFGGLQMLAGSVTSTAADYMNFLQMIMHRGVFEGTLVLTEEAINEMEKSQTKGIS